MDVVQTVRTGEPSHYRAYLNSPSWRTRRNRALKDAGWQCQRCTSKRSLQVHHLAYERLGAERDQDLQVLCENCHRDEHVERPDQTSLGLYLKVASSLIREHPYSRETDLADDMKRRCAELKLPLNIQRINDAISTICGNRMTKEQQQHEEKYAHIPERDRPVSRQEAREFLGLLGITNVVDAIAKPMPHAKPSKIDIYGPVPRDEWGEHDRY